MNCPHCGSTLLWSEDRGAHCDGCDKYKPEPAPIAATVTPKEEDIYDAVAQYRKDNPEPQLAIHVKTDAELLEVALQQEGKLERDLAAVKELSELQRLSGLATAKEMIELQADLTATRQRCERLEARWNYIKTDIDGARALLILLKGGKGTPEDFDTMVDRIIESRKQALTQQEASK